MDYIELKFNSKEFQLVMSALAELPWKVSNALIVNLEQQAIKTQEQHKEA